MSSLLVLTHFLPSADESNLPRHVEQYLRDTLVRRHFIYEPFRYLKEHEPPDCTAADAREFCLLAVRSPMVNGEENTLAHRGTASFLEESGVGILWTSLNEHVQLDLPPWSSWDEASPHLE